MTTIGKDLPLALTQTQAPLVRLMVGAKLLADVIGPTRNGLSVQVEHGSFFLQAKGELPEARALTLQVTEVKSDTDHKVQILALNDRLLPKPVQAQLTRKPALSPVQPAPVTIAEDSPIDVTAQPVTQNGKALGPPLMVRLTIQIPSQLQPLLQSQPQPVLTLDQNQGPTGSPTSNEPIVATIGKSTTASASGKAAPLLVVPAIETGVVRTGPLSPAHDEVGGKPSPDTQPQHPKIGSASATISSTQTAIPPREAGATTVATVVGRSPGSGQVLLQTPDLLTKIEQPVDLPLGTASASGKAASLPVVPAIETGIVRSSPLLPAHDEASVKPSPDTQPQHPKTGSASTTTNPVQTAIPTREAGATTIATVVGRSSGSGQVLLQTPDLLMKIEQPVDLPLGAALQMTLLTKPAPYGPQLDPNLSTDEGNPLTRLIELLDAIDQPGRTTEELGGPAGRRQLPMAERDLAAKLLQLITLQTGHAVDDTSMTAHHRNSTSLSKAHQIRNLLSELGGSASEPLADGWRSLTLPLGPDPTQALMIFHREHDLDRESDETGQESDDTVAQRAVFDINFSCLGRCQIDVLCQHQRFDLLVRSEKPLDAGNQQEINDLFSSACEIAGLSGDISYRHGQFVEPAKMTIATKTVTT